MVSRDFCEEHENVFDLTHSVVKVDSQPRKDTVKTNLGTQVTMKIIDNGILYIVNSSTQEIQGRQQPPLHSFVTASYILIFSRKRQSPS